jgi:hypothetical protein
MSERELAADLERFVHQLYAELGRRNVDHLAAVLDPDVRLLDERTGRWTYGPDAVVEGTRAELGAAESYSNRIEEVEARMIGPDIGMVTYVWFGQGTWEGVEYNIRCPSSLVARRDGDGWRVVLMHSVPADERAPEG